MAQHPTRAQAVLNAVHELETHDRHHHDPLPSIVGGRRDVPPCQPISGDLEAAVPVDMGEPPGMFSFRLHADFLRFEFMQVAQSHNEVPKDLKDEIMSEQTQTALVAALISTMVLSLILEVKGTTHDLKFPFACVSVLACLLLMLSVCFSIFYMLMINEFKTLDALAYWIEDIGPSWFLMPECTNVSTTLHSLLPWATFSFSREIALPFHTTGWRATLPARMFMMGTFLGLAGIFIYILIIFDTDIIKAWIIIGGVFGLYLLLHWQLARALDC